ncbi:MAG: hypothetical protein MSC43_05315 [Clostridiales bacterium]|nr:hypothetical protein [Clostridiales bacterium]MDD7432687.1 hypothetical protein [Clostridiales bacterium]MDY3060919.1 hypothetical protein [Eubacteriales bacterium]
MKTQRQGLTTKRRKLLGLYLALALLVQLFFSTGAEAAARSVKLSGYQDNNYALELFERLNSKRAEQDPPLEPLLWMEDFQDFAFCRAAEAVLSEKDDDTRRPDGEEEKQSLKSLFDVEDESLFTTQKYSAVAEDVLSPEELLEAWLEDPELAAALLSPEQKTFALGAFYEPQSMREHIALFLSQAELPATSRPVDTEKLHEAAEKPAELQEFSLMVDLEGRQLILQEVQRNKEEGLLQMEALFVTPAGVQIPIPAEELIWTIDEAHGKKLDPGWFLLTAEGAATIRVSVDDETGVTELAQSTLDVAEDDFPAPTIDPSVSESESIAASVSESESIAASVSESESVEASIRESIAASEAESKAKASESESIAASEAESKAKASESESIAASESESKARASESESIAASEAESKAKASESESIAASEAESKAKASESESIAASEAESKAKASESESIAASEAESKAKASESESIAASEAESKARASESESIAASEAESKAKASESESKAKASESESRAKVSESESRAKASESQSKARASEKESIAESIRESIRESIKESENKKKSGWTFPGLVLPRTPHRTIVVTNPSYVHPQVPSLVRVVPYPTTAKTSASEPAPTPAPQLQSKWTWTPPAAGQESRNPQPQESRVVEKSTFSGLATYTRLLRTTPSHTQKATLVPTALPTRQMENEKQQTSDLASRLALGAGIVLLAAALMLLLYRILLSKGR